MTRFPDVRVRRRWRRWWGRGLALTLLAGMITADVLLDLRHQPEFPSVAYVIPIIVAAGTGGFWFGLFATGISLITIGADHLPLLGGHPMDVHEVFRLIALAVAGVVVSSLSGRLRLAKRRADATRRQFAEMFNLNPVGTALVRLADHRLIAANDAFLFATEWARDEAIGRTMSDLRVFREEDRAQMVERAARGETISGFEAPFHRRDGSERQGLASIRLVNVEGEPHVLGVLVDITDSKRTEERLRDTDERFKELAESIREVFWMTDPAKGEMLYISPAYETIWGRSCESLYRSPRDWLEAIHPDDREQVGRALEKQGSGGYDEEYRIVRPDGSVRWIRDKAFPMRNEQGVVIRVAGVAEDITEARQLRAQLNQTQKLESVGLLAGGVAHDFNNLLTVIQANADMLLDHQSPEDSAEMLNDVRRAAERGTALTRQLLAFSRQEMLEPRVLNINAVVNDTAKLLRRLIGEDIELRVDLSPDVSPVMIDPGHFSQVLMNLAVNARDAMPQGGAITIASRNETVTEADCDGAGCRPGSYVRLTLSDTGAGMSPEVRARIFEPFFTTKGTGRGTGLGLSVVHGIVAQSGGHIEVVSEVGHGTTFAIFLPVTAEALTPGAVEDGASLRGSETILLAEDEENVRRVAARTLRARGYRVLEARDGNEALTLLTKYTGGVDLLLTDVVMPRMDGRTLAEAVGKWGNNPKVLYTSGYTDDDVVRHGVMRAEVKFLQKPYTPVTLTRKVREVLDAKPAPSQRLARVRTA